MLCVEPAWPSSRQMSRLQGGAGLGIGQKADATHCCQHLSCASSLGLPAWWPCRFLRQREEQAAVFPLVRLRMCGQHCFVGVTAQQLCVFVRLCGTVFELQDSRQGSALPVAYTVPSLREFFYCLMPHRSWVM